MTAPLVITMPAGTRPDLEALRAEFGQRAIYHQWHPSRATLPGALHLTCMHPQDLRAAGCHEFIERGWHTPVAMRQRGFSTLATNLCLVLAIATSAAFVGPALDDIGAAQDVATELQAGTQAAQRRARMEAAAQAMCGGENASAVWLADGSVQCRTKQGKHTQRVTLAEVQQ